MAVDVVGYSRLMGKDETGTLAALKRLRAELIEPAIAAYQGRIVKLMGTARWSNSRASSTPSNARSKSNDAWRNDIAMSWRASRSPGDVPPDVEKGEVGIV